MTAVDAREFDVLVVGAGLSGVGAACRLQTMCPELTYAILEGRDAIGGTWDLFRYPGIRSDSDMFTLGYPFRPWREAKAIADGPSILRYIRDTAAAYGVDRHVRFRHHIVAAAWSSRDARWTVDAEVGPARTPTRYRCRFLYLCSGYYRYDAAHAPTFPGAARFRGTVVHPQWWPEDLDYAGKRVVVIGSGATAVTLVPSLAERAAHVTMLQRSPTWIMSLPARDKIADAVRGALPPRLAHGVVRAKNVVLGQAFFQFCRRFPGAAKALIQRRLAKVLPADVPLAPHFTPRYAPWDQRLCLVPDDDLFLAMRRGKAAVVTDTIDTFTETGIKLASGDELAADIIVTATGLQIVPCGGIALTVDGRAVDLREEVVYKGLMLDGVPNLAWCVGYTNASWTLRADLSSQFVCRLLHELARRGADQVVAHIDPADTERRPLLDLSSGYVVRAADALPKQGTRAPWFLRQNYLRDFVTMRLGRISDDALTWSRKAGVPAHAPRRAPRRRWARA